jgi:hypothetical protein
MCNLCFQLTRACVVVQSEVFIRTAAGHFALRALVPGSGADQDATEAPAALPQQAVAAKPKAQKQKLPVCPCLPLSRHVTLYLGAL